MNKLHGVNLAHLKHIESPSAHVINNETHASANHISTPPAHISTPPAHNAPKKDETKEKDHGLAQSQGSSKSLLKELTQTMSMAQNTVDSIKGESQKRNIRESLAKSAVPAKSLATQNTLKALSQSLSEIRDKLVKSL